MRYRYPSANPSRPSTMTTTVPTTADKPVELLPYDDANQRLEANVHPPDWANPVPAGRYNLVVIGAGTAGLVAAAGAAVPKGASEPGKGQSVDVVV